VEGIRGLKGVGVVAGERKTTAVAAVARRKTGSLSEGVVVGAHQKDRKQRGTGKEKARKERLFEIRRSLNKGWAT